MPKTCNNCGCKYASRVCDICQSDDGTYEDTLDAAENATGPSGCAINYFPTLCFMVGIMFGFLLAMAALSKG